MTTGKQKIHADKTSDAVKEAYAVVVDDRMTRVKSAKLKIDAILEMHNCYLYSAEEGPAIAANDPPPADAG